MRTLRQAFRLVVLFVLRCRSRPLGMVTTSVVALWLAGAAHADSQRGGVPSLDNRVAALEAIVTTLQVSTSNQSQQVAALQAQVASLQGQLAQQSSQVAGLQTTVSALQTALTSATTKLGCMSKVGTDVFFDGCNVYIRSGGGSTDAPVNGLGNLIVGYNEIQYGGIFRTGSHNLIVGRNNSYTSYGGFVAGELNTVSGPAASVGGGLQNTASGIYATVGGGGENVASNDRSVVSGGTFNKATGGGATVSGGGFNIASAIYSTVSGGYANQASGNAATVSGGAGRAATSADNWAAGTLYEQF